MGIEPEMQGRAAAGAHVTAPARELYQINTALALRMCAGFVATWSRAVVAHHAAPASAERRCGGALAPVAARPGRAIDPLVQSRRPALTRIFEACRAPPSTARRVMSYVA